MYVKVGNLDKATIKFNEGFTNDITGKLVKLNQYVF